MSVVAATFAPQLIAGCAPSCEALPGRPSTHDGRQWLNRYLEFLKQQRGMRQFRTRGLARVSNEFTLATMAYNLTRRHTMQAG